MSNFSKVHKKACELAAELRVSAADADKRVATEADHLLEQVESVTTWAAMHLARVEMLEAQEQMRRAEERYRENVERLGRATSWPWLSEQERRCEG